MIVEFKFNSWFYGSKGPMNVGNPDDVQGNLDKLRERGHITQEQYDSAVSGLKATQNNDEFAYIQKLRDDNYITEEQYITIKANMLKQKGVIENPQEKSDAQV
ncbi:MAG: SHOCT domain-containing protein [Bacteroidaceae bacterium]|nr:SHOCT domain-containing protein [Bacteroidaceae bacterium]